MSGIQNLKMQAIYISTKIRETIRYKSSKIYTEFIMIKTVNERIRMQWKK